MELNKNIEKELIAAIEAAINQGDSFPIEVTTKGNIKHKIAKESSQGHLISTIEYKGQDYLIYLI